jgi:hypothetical protein
MATAPRRDKTLMAREQALPDLLGYRKELWINHCKYILNKLLIPIANTWKEEKNLCINYGAIIIENRIDCQWLFTILNTLVMCPKGTQICLVTDRANKEKAEKYLTNIEFPITPWWGLAENMVMGTDLENNDSFNKLMKNAEFWKKLPHQKLLIIQTDALLAQPLPAFFFEFPYLGSPFLPQMQTEYFHDRKKNGDVEGFFKVETALHNSPNKMVYPHLYGNGGLSIRDKNLMIKICTHFSETSCKDEMEDVFFSKHLSKYYDPAPIEVAQAFAFESRYQPMAIGCHAAWKYLDSRELGEYFERHWKETWALAQ